MSFKLVKKRLARKIKQWVDPCFDVNNYEDLNFITEDDADYYEARRLILSGNIYCLFVNLDDNQDCFFRKLIFENGKEYYTGLDDDFEFNTVLKNFIQRGELPFLSVAAKNSDLMGAKSDGSMPYAGSIDESGEHCLGNRNRKSKAAFLISSVFWFLLVMFGYRQILFCELPGLSEAISNRILWIGASLLTAVGTLAAFTRRRNGISIAANVLLPIGIYSCISYCRFLPKSVTCILLIAAVLSLANIFLVLRYSDSKSAKQISLKDRIVHGLSGSIIIVAFSLTVFLVGLYINFVTSHQLFTSDIEPITSLDDAASEWTIKNKIDTVKLLQEDEWEKLDVQERLDVLATVVNIEVEYLGLNHGINLESGVLNDGILAHFNYDTKCIVIDLDHINSESAKVVLESITHECYHSYQHQQVDLYLSIPEEHKNLLMFDDVKDYCGEFEHNFDPDEDFAEYYLSTSEINARSYSEWEADRYYSLIEHYTS